jgi:hypothetical protein
VPRAVRGPESPPPPPPPPLFGVGLRLCTAAAAAAGGGGRAGRVDGEDGAAVVVGAEGWAQQGAADLGLRAGSRVLAINGAPCAAMSDSDLAAALEVRP